MQGCARMEIIKHRMEINKQRMEIGKQRMEAAVHCCARMELDCAMLCKNGD